MTDDFKKKVKAGTVGWKSPYKHPEDFYSKGPKDLVLSMDNNHSVEDPVGSGHWKSVMPIKRVMKDGSLVPMS